MFVFEKWKDAKMAETLIDIDSSQNTNLQFPNWKEVKFPNYGKSEFQKFFNKR